MLHKINFDKYDNINKKNIITNAFSKFEFSNFNGS